MLVSRYCYQHIKTTHVYDQYYQHIVYNDYCLLIIFIIINTNLYY